MNATWSQSLLTSLPAFWISQSLTWTYTKLMTLPSWFNCVLSILMYDWANCTWRPCLCAATFNGICSDTNTFWSTVMQKPWQAVQTSWTDIKRMMWTECRLRTYLIQEMIQPMRALQWEAIVLVGTFIRMPWLRNNKLTTKFSLKCVVMCLEWMLWVKFSCTYCHLMGRRLGVYTMSSSVAPQVRKTTSSVQAKRMCHLKK